MIDTLPTERLRTFATVAETGSYTEAAEQLYRSQPALSQQMKKLEEQLGVPLFRRSGRTTLLTEAGHVLLGYARRILDLNEEAITKLALTDARGTVRVGVLEEVTHGPLVRLLTRFGRLATGIRIELEVSTSWELVRRIQRNDLCLAIANSVYSDHPATALWDEPYVWAVSSDLNYDPDGPLQLISDPIDSPCAGFRSAVAALSASGRPHETVFSSMSLLATQAAIRAGLGVGMISESACTDDMTILGAADGLPDLEPAHIALYRGTEANGAAASGLSDFLIDHLRHGALDQDL